MRIGVMILPEKRWSESMRQWRTADELGFDSAWTYDHISWRGLQDGPWFSALPVLTAAACATSRISLGAMVVSPNYRHPVTTAKDAIALDDISDGRFVLGVGAGAVGAGDSEVITRTKMSRRARTARFEEFVDMLDQLLRNPVTTSVGNYFSCYEARMTPGCVQQPRLPLAIAAAGNRGLALTARHGQAWVTTGPVNWADGFTERECLDAVADQVQRLRSACERICRDPAELDRILVATDFAGDFFTSPERFLDLAECYAKAGISHIVVHWPRPEGIYAGDESALHRIAEEALPAARDIRSHL